jgi:Fuc2NAc and GlcNAc transferase
MPVPILLQVLLGAGSVFLLTWLVVLIAERDRWWEAPSSRGSHEQPTLTRGGIAFVVFLLITLPISLKGAFAVIDILVVTLASLAIAIVGFFDDANPLPVLPRLLVQLFASSVAMFFLWDLFSSDNWWPQYLSPLLVAVALVLLWVWFINFFNFMDGIDGIASAETLFIGLVGAWLCAEAGQLELASAWAMLSGAALGFLLWNAPRAKIFMGDVGSGFLGFIVGGLLLLSVDAGVFSPWVALLLVIAFIGDATVTLLRRMLRGERWYEGHRQHAYQHLAIRWGSHGKVTLAYTAFNVLAVVPAVWLVNRHPDSAMLVVVVAAAIVMALCLLAGAGAPAEPTEDGPRTV